MSDHTFNHPVAQVSNDAEPLSLLKNLWRTRYWVLAFVVLSIGGYAFWLLATQSDYPDQVRYSQTFSFEFDGITDGQFPDGSPFILSNLISPTVLNRVHQQHDLGSEGISPDRLSRSISIEPMAPGYFDIIAEFRQRLATGDRSASEIADLQEAFERALTQNQRGVARIYLTLPMGAQLAPNRAEAMLADIGNTWAERVTGELGVLQLDVPIYSPRLFDDTRFENLDYLIAIELLLENINRVRGNIAALQRQPNAASVQDPETGFTLEDLDKAFADLAQYDLRRLIDPVRELGLTENPAAVQLFYRRRLAELNLDAEQAQGRVAATREVLTSVRSIEAANSIGAGAGTGISPQLGDGFLDRLIELSEEGGVEAYRRELSQRVLEAEQRLLTIQRRRDEIDNILSAIEEAEQNPDDRVRQQFAERINTDLPTILATLRDYTAVVGRLHETLGNRVVSSGSEVITVQADGFQVESPQLVTRLDLYRVIALVILAGLAGLLIGWVQQRLRRRP